ncbi:MAG: AAA family ATPase, partial [Bacteroidota bacterium]
LMPVDLKRQGRAEEHLALFYPSTRESREELLRVMMKKTDTAIDIEQAPEALLDGVRTYSGADMEALLTRSKFRTVAHTTNGKGGKTKKTRSGNMKVPPEILAEVVEDFIPPTYPLEVELQSLAAVLECTSRDMLPEQYREMDREQVVRRVKELKRLIGE